MGETGRERFSLLRLRRGGLSFALLAHGLFLLVVVPFLIHAATRLDDPRIRTAVILVGAAAFAFHGFQHLTHRGHHTLLYRAYPLVLAPALVLAVVLLSETLVTAVAALMLVHNLTAALSIATRPLRARFAFGSKPRAFTAPRESRELVTQQLTTAVVASAV